jgi:hypothetical protein
LSLFTSLTFSAGTLHGEQNSSGPGPPYAGAAAVDNGLVAHYPLDGDVLDVSGNGHHGVNTGVTFQPARIGLGAVFDGNSSRHVRVDTFPEIRSNLTVATFFKPQQLLPSGAGSPLIGQGLTTQSAYTLFVNYSFVNGLLNWNSPTRFDAQVTIPTLSDDTFYHIALVYDTQAGKVRIYLNGQSQGVLNYSTPLYAQTEPLYLGVSFPGGLEVFRGVLDDVRIYNRALSGEEVATLAGLTNDPPVIVVQPRPRTNVVSSSLTLSVTATGTEPLSYQWFKNETAVPGATGRILVLANVQLTDAGTYRVTVSNVVSFLTSSNAELTVLPLEPPSIIGGPLTNPANGHLYYLLAQSTWVEAEAAAQALGGHLTTLRNAVEQQWVFTNFSTWGGQERILWIGLHDADPVNNATNPITRRTEFVWASGEPVTYSNWSAVEPNNYRDRGEYYVHTLPPSEPTEPGAWVDAWDADFNGRSLHGVVELYAGEPPVIVLQPLSRTNVVGSSLALSVRAEGTGSLAYQWFKDGGPLPGANGQTLLLASVGLADVGTYQVRVSGSGGFVFSSNAVVTIVPAALPSVLAGPIINPANNHKYYLMDQSTWVEAEAAAQGLGGHLTTLRNAGEQQWVFTNFSLWGGQERILWIGLHDADPVNNATNPITRRTEFVWSSGEPVTYANWSAVEPNNYRERGEYYVHTLPPSEPTEPGAWVDAWDVDFNGRPLHGVVEVGGAPVEEPSSWTLGEKSFLLMRVNFPDDLTEPISEEDAYSEMAEVNDFYRRNSYGKYSLRATVTPLLTLPRTKQDYAGFGFNPILRDARESARAAGYDTAAFDLDCVYFQGLYSTGGKAVRGAKGIWAKARGVIAHELGHNLGLGEADSWFAFGQSVIGPGEWWPYGNLFDVMGGAPGQFNTRSKEYLGWFSNSNVETVFANGTYRLYTFETTNIAAAVPCALVVHKDEARDYWIEFRTETNQWNHWTQYGVLLSWNGSPGSLDTDLLNMNPELGRNTDDLLHAPLLLGRTFSDREAGIHITPLRKNATIPPSIDVVINVGDFAANQPPSVAVTPSATQVATGNLVTLTATAFDPDGDTLSFAWDFSDSTLGTVGSQVTHAWNAPGEYVVRCAVSDLKGGMASAFIIVRVGMPDTRRISGRITAGGQPVEGVRVYASLTNSTLTSSDGCYSLTGLAGGHYSILPTKAYYLFAPTSVNVSASNLSLSGVNFTAETTTTPNTAPLVSFNSPQNGLTHLAGTSLELRVDAYDDGSITNVSFYEGTNFIGSGRYGITWANVPAGQYVLRAVATDDLGLAANSADVEITVVSEPAANDAFSNRVPLSGPLVSVVGHDVAATTEPGEPDPPGYYAYNSVWYSWVAPSNGLVAVSIRADRAVATIYRGSSLVNLVRVAFGWAWSGPVFLAEQGATYQIAVDGLGSAGTIELSIRPAHPPMNDNFAGRIAISASLPATVTASNVDATLEAGEPIHGYEAGGASVWWSWMAPESGAFTITTEGNGFYRTYVAVYTGTNLQNLGFVAGRGFGQVSFKAVGGTVYQIAVDAERRGQITVKLRRANPPLNDDFANRTIVSGTNVTAAASNVDASLEPGEPYPSVGTVWWSWSAPFSGPVFVRSGPTGFPVAIYTGTTLATLTFVPSEIIGGSARFNAVAGTAYQIVLNSSYGVSESFPLRIERVLPPMNDDFDNRLSLSGFVSTGFGANAEATAEAGEPQHSPPTAPGHSMWWTWTAPATGAFILDAQNSSFATALAVYTGNTLGSLARVADNSAGGNQMTFSAEAGASYQIAVDGKSGATGNIQFTLRPAFVPPNDNFANRIALTGSTVHVIGFNIGASAEPGEPVNITTGGASVWWTWTAPDGGLYTVTVTGTTFRVLFGVYTGSTLGTLVRVAGDGLSCFDPAAQTTFRATAGTRYQIAVDGFLGAAGAIQLDLRPAQPPSNDDFASRTQLAGPSFREEANNFEASTEPNEPRHYPGSGPAEGTSVWWRWTAPATGKYTVQLNPSRVQLLVIYTGNTLSNLTRVAEGPGTTGSGSRASFLAVAGVEYQIAVAGLESVTDEFTLTLGPAASPPNDDFADRELLAGTAVRVSGSTVEAIREANEPIAGAGASVWYTWIAPVAGEVAINTEYNDAPTGLTVYTGSTLLSLVRMPQSSSSYGGYGVFVRFSAVAGRVYQIMVHSLYGSQGAFYLRLIETPTPTEEMPVFALPVQLEDGAVQLQLSGQPNRAYVLEASEDLESWIPIATNSAPSGVLIWTDFSATNLTQRFFRARLP